MFHHTVHTSGLNNVSSDGGFINSELIYNWTFLNQDTLFLSIYYYLHEWEFPAREGSDLRYESNLTSPTVDLGQQVVTRLWGLLGHSYASSRRGIKFRDAPLWPGLPWWLSGKESACQCRRLEFNSWVGKIPWRRKWQPTVVFFPGKSLGQRSLADYSPWGRKRVRHNLGTKKQQKQQPSHPLSHPLRMEPASRILVLTGCSRGILA